ncbi:MAG: efflux RND transporter periplasmic adaptor subunit [Bacteroidetes bacterium]|nr:efflux RND transporter periplasmic adaptor subunit [Bacteroidota bacterium]
MNKKTIITAIVTLVAGLLLGWLIFGGSETEPTNEHLHDTELAEETIWTCSMHPQIRQPEPGDCPICGMDLILLENEEEGIDPNAISMSPTAMQLANIQTAVVGYMDPVKKVRLNGKVQSDERLVYSQSSHIPGRIEELMVSFTGEYVQKGQVIASVYSPEMVTAQEELFEAQKIRKTQPALFRAAKEKLKNWKLTQAQIQQILESGSTRETFDIQADVSGYVTEKMVNSGDYVNRGQAIYEIADLSRIWVLFDVYESDMTWVSRGDEITFTVASLPGETFKGEISFLDPVIDPKTRVAKARVVKSNPGLKLKPEMLASGVVEAELPNQDDKVVVPKTAVMWTGERSVVYVKSETETAVDFIIRDVTLGPGLGESYIIEEGLEEGEEIAIHGTFSIDAAAQLAGKPSMMNPEGGKVSTGHDHSGIPMSDEEMENRDAGQSSKTKTPAETPMEFKMQFGKVVDGYLLLKDALVDSDEKQAESAAQKTLEALDGADMTLLKGDAHNRWMKLLKPIKYNLNGLIQMKGLEMKRSHFSIISNKLTEAIETFGFHSTQAKSLYLEFCPMAFDNKGAYWLSESKEIRNPYFGDKMMKCGEVKKEINK